MRIATRFIHQLAATDIQRAQTQLFETQRQAGTERKADDLKGYGVDANALISARGFADLSNAYVAAGEELQNRLAIQDLSLGEVSSAAEEMRDAVNNALALDNGSDVMSRIELAFTQVVSALNATNAGKFVFGGVRDDAPPVNVTTLADLDALATADLAFDNAPRPASVQLDQRTVLQAGPLANEAGEELFAAIKRIQAYEAANGPFGTNLTAAQRAFLQDQITGVAGVHPGLPEVNENITAAHAANGGVQQRAESFVNRQRDQQDYYEGLVRDIESVDLAEVAARLSQAQTQLQASAQVYATVRASSLLDLL